MSKISGTVTTTVVLGSATYPSPLTIYAGGMVAPTAFGANGVYSDLAGNSLTTNVGSGIYGGSGANGTNGVKGGVGGEGVDVRAGTTIANSGAIIGGAGGNGYSGSNNDYGGAGGYGINFYTRSPGGYTLTNFGKISGGAGGTGSDGGSGGTGVYLSAGNTLNNQMDINGGAGGAGGFDGGPGGVGVQVDGTLTNAGFITGGTSGYGAYHSGTGGTGVVDDGSVTNSGHIVGGLSVGSGESASPNGGVGVYVFNGTLTNTSTGSITGGTGGFGGAGAVVANYAALINFGAITGGESLTLGSANSPALAGVAIDSGTLTNYGTITGSYGLHSYDFMPRAGPGVSVSNGTLVNTAGGTINGGTAGPAYFGGNGGSGVDGIGAAITITNAGRINGGAGGTGNALAGLNKSWGGAGGAGVILDSGTLHNTGQIYGGAGGADVGEEIGQVMGSYGGAGVYLNGGTLITSGKISGGQGGAGGYTLPGAMGDAVQFGPTASTMVVDPGAVFDGQIAASASVNDVLELSGPQLGGTPITLGTQFTNFSTLDFASGAVWTVNASTGAAPSSGLTISGFTISDSIDISNLTPTQVAADFNPTTHVLSTTDGTLRFSAPPSGEAFFFVADGSGGTDVTVAASVISTTLTSTVTLGSAAHPSPLKITNAGSVAPSVAATTGVVSNLSGNSLTNAGAIFGGAGSSGSAGSSGGLGVDFKAAGTITNIGSIAGGAGGNGSAGAGGAGGAGVDLLAGTLTNDGGITGGAGGAGSTSGGAGGSGVTLDGGTLTTMGTISGGAGGSGLSSGTAGDAVHFGTVASTLTVDPGAVFNGAIGAFGFNDTIDIANLTPAQVEADFNSSTHTLSTPSDGTLDFAGHFSGDAFLFSNDGSGGTDIDLAVGSGISSILTSTVTLGSTAHPSPLTITNAGGVAPTVAGATGVISKISGDTLTNNGTIRGGAGNSGSVGGTGGPGVNFTAGTLTNNGTITGGNGGSGTTTGGNGGNAVLLSGGTLINSSTVSAGQGGSGSTNGASGDAVKFGAVASTVVVDPGAVFNGQVVANTSASDVLELSGTQSGGTAITLGSQFMGFHTLDFASGAAWTVDATKTDLTAHTLAIKGFALGNTLDITNLTEKGATLSFSTANDVLTITKGTTTINLQFDSAFAGEHFVLTANGAGTDVTLQSNANPTLAAAGHDLMNFVGDEHRVLMDVRFTSMHDTGPSLMPTESAAAQDFTSYGFASQALIDHGVAHAAFGVCKA